MAIDGGSMGGDTEGNDGAVEPHARNCDLKEVRAIPRRRRGIFAFAIGCVVHILLLCIATYCTTISGGATLMLLIVAFPGLVIDMSAEVIRPSPTGTFALATAATVMNGIFYMTVALVGARISAYPKGRSRDRNP